MRSQFGKGDAAYDGGRMHRSSASRDLFDAAARLADDAGSETMTALHMLKALLTSPTPVMAGVLEGAAGPRAPKPSETPLLEQYGRDLTQMARDGELKEVTERQAECKALLRNLAREPRQSVVLGCDSKRVVDAVVSAAAQAIAAGDVPAALKRKRLIDVTGTTWRGETGPDRMQLIAEAAGAADVILVAPPLKAPAEDAAPDAWWAIAEQAMKDASAQMICRADAAVCESAEGDVRWAKVARVMRLQDTTQDEIPWEL